MREDEVYENVLALATNLDFVNADRIAERKWGEGALSMPGSFR